MRRTFTRRATVVGVLGAALVGCDSTGSVTEAPSAPVPSESPPQAVDVFNPEPAICLDNLLPPPCWLEVVSSYNVEIRDDGTVQSWDSAFPLSRTRGAYEWRMTKEVVPPPMEAWFEARAWDAEGKVVPGVVVGWIAFPSAQYFCEELLGCGEEDEAGIMGFATISLPGTSGVERVALLSHGELVDERAAGAQAPVFESVTMTEVSDGMLVEWVAFDPDGDPLEYRFEVRGRATTVVRWPPSFGGLSMTESSMVLDPSWFDCSGACRLVVVASDGINTAWATVDPVEVTAPSP